MGAMMNHPPRGRGECSYCGRPHKRGKQRNDSCRGHRTGESKTKVRIPASFSPRRAAKAPFSGPGLSKLARRAIRAAAESHVTMAERVAVAEAAIQ